MYVYIYIYTYVCIYIYIYICLPLHQMRDDQRPRTAYGWPLESAGVVAETTTPNRSRLRLRHARSYVPLRHDRSECGGAAKVIV